MQISSRLMAAPWLICGHLGIISQVENTRRFGRCAPCPVPVRKPLLLGGDFAIVDASVIPRWRAPLAGALQSLDGKCELMHDQAKRARLHEARSVHAPDRQSCGRMEAPGRAGRR